MTRLVLTSWYILTALLGPKVLCLACCPTMIAPTVVATPSVATAPAKPLKTSAAPRCCSTRAHTASAPAENPLQPADPLKPVCPCKDRLSPDLAAVVLPASATVSDWLDLYASHFTAWHDTSFNLVTGLARPGDRNTDRLLPFPSTYDLVCVFHIMRC